MKKIEFNVLGTVAVEWKPQLPPVHHKLVPIQATFEQNDGTSGIASIVLTSITSSGAANGTGDGNTSDDILGAEYGTADTLCSLHTERSSSRDGRVAS